MTPLFIDINTRLASGYGELTRLDQALREAEQRLNAAHRLCAGQHGTRQAKELYREIIALRDRSRLVLADLGEIWIAES